MKRLGDLDLTGKRVFVRVDFNVPLKDGRIADDSRITGALATLREIRAKASKLIVASHLGRPKPDKEKGMTAFQPDPKYSLAPVRDALAAALDCPVHLLAESVIDRGQAALDALPSGGILLLENTRFYPGETKNDPELSKAFAALCDIYVSDAFGAAHRAHASTVGITEHVADGGAGFLVERELQYLAPVLKSPAHPFVLILGGAKVEDKIGVFENMLDKVDHILVGGAMAYTFLKAKGFDTGSSRVEEDKLEFARAMLAKGKGKIVLPMDHVAAMKFEAGSAPMEIPGTDIPPTLMGLDIGPQTIKKYASIIKQAALVLWNGPMGVFEWESYQRGSNQMAKAMSQCAGVTIVSGGDTVAAAVESGYAAKMKHISTGGGATLEYLEGKELPGLAALEKFAKR